MAKYLNATRALMMGKATINTDGLFDDDEDDGEEERKKSPSSRWAKLRAFVTKKADHTKKTKRSAAALLEVFRQAIEERNVLFENKSHEVEDSEEVISVIDLWNILEGMGTFLTGAEVIIHILSISSDSFTHTHTYIHIDRRIHGGATYVTPKTT